MKMGAEIFSVKESGLRINRKLLEVCFQLSLSVLKRNVNGGPVQSFGASEYSLFSGFNTLPAEIYVSGFYSALIVTVQGVFVHNGIYVPELSEIKRVNF